MEWKENWMKKGSDLSSITYCKTENNSLDQSELQVPHTNRDKAV